MADEGSVSGNSHWMKSWVFSSAASSNARTSKIVRPRASVPSPSRKARTEGVDAVSVAS